MSMYFQPQAVSGSQEMYGTNQSSANPPATYPSVTGDYSQYNPYVSANQYQSSFMSGEGAQSLQNIMGAQPPTYSQAGSQAQYSNYPHSQPPPPVAGAPPPPAGQYGMTTAAGSYTPGYNPSQYPAGAVPPGPPVATNRPAFQSSQSQQFQGGSYSQYPPYQNYQQPGQQQGYDQQQYPGGGSYPAGTAGGQRHRASHGQASQRHPQPRGSSALTTVRITGR